MKGDERERGKGSCIDSPEREMSERMMEDGDNDDAVAIDNPDDPNLLWAAQMRPYIQDSDSLPEKFKFAPNSASYKVSRYGKGTNVYLYGTDEAGHSVGIRAHGFRPYLYVSLKPIDEATTDETQRMLLINALIEDLQARLLAICAASEAKWSSERVAFCASFCGRVVRSADKKSIALVPGDNECKPIVDWKITSGIPVRGSGAGYGYRGINQTRFLQLFFYSPNLVSKCRALLQGEHALLGISEQVRELGRFSNRDSMQGSALQERAAKKKGAAVLGGRQRTLGEFVREVEDNEEIVTNPQLDAALEDENEELAAILREYELDDRNEPEMMDISDGEDVGDMQRTVVVEEICEAAEDASDGEDDEDVQQRECKWYKDKEDIGDEHPLHIALTARLEARFVRLVNRALARVMETSSPLHVIRFDVFEADIDFVLRFAIDCGFSYEQWVNIDLKANGEDGASLVQRAFSGGGKGAARRETLQQIELHCHYSALKFDASDPIQNTMPKHIELSLDCEMQTGPDGAFPKPQNESVLICSCIIKDKRVVKGRPPRPPGDNKAAFWYREVSFQIGAAECKTKRPDNCWDRIVFSFTNEAMLFLALSRFIRELGPTLVTGYNTDGFDFPYMQDRADVLKVGDEFRRAWGRSCLSPNMSIKESHFESTAVGHIKFNDVRAEGVIFIDLFIKLKKDPMVKLRSLSLNSVAAHYLGEAKEDVAYSRINELSQTVAGREILRSYCAKDALLPLMVFHKEQIVQSMVEMARINVCSMYELLKRGQQIRSKCYIYKNAALSSPPERVYTRTAAEREAEAGTTFEGAGVIDPEVALFENPVATLDWNSLYPSIMVTYNFCFSTVIAPDYNVHADPYLMRDPDPLKNLSYEERCKRAEEAIYTVEECKTREPFTEGTREGSARFLRHHMKVGLTTGIIQRLLAERSKIKKQQKAAEDDKDYEMAALFEQRQLQVKLLGNSLYGLFGATTSFGYCPEVSASVTCRGRALLYFMRWIVMTEFAEHKPRIVYGDTDSIFVLFPLSMDINFVAELASQMAKRITAVMRATYCTRMPQYNILNLEFEKVYRTLLLIAKKKYCGLLYKYAGRDNDLIPFPGDGLPSVSGLETKRRDTTLLIKTEIMHVIALILDYKHILSDKMRRAREYVWRVAVRPLLEGTMNLHNLTITRQLRMLPRQYAAENSGAALPIHVQLAAKLTERAGGEKQPNAPRAGDRLPYVVIAGAPDQPVSERAEDPVFALENNKPIDGQYYLDKHVRSSILRLFVPIVRGLKKQTRLGNKEPSAEALDEQKKQMEREAAEYVFGHPERYVDHGMTNEYIYPATLMKEEKTIAERAAKGQIGIVSPINRRTGVPLRIVRYRQTEKREVIAEVAMQETKKPSGLSSFSRAGSRCQSCSVFVPNAQRGVLCDKCEQNNDLVADNGRKAAREAQKCLTDIEDLRSERAELAATCHACMGCSSAPTVIVCPNSECAVFWRRRYNTKSEEAARSKLRALAPAARKSDTLNSF